MSVERRKKRYASITANNSKNQRGIANETKFQQDYSNTNKKEAVDALLKKYNKT